MAAGDSILTLNQPGLFPDPPENTFKNENHDTWIEEGVYLQGKFSIGDLLGVSGEHFLNTGLRYDRSSYYGNNVTLRIGYVGQFERFRLKALFGQAYKVPAARQLFGGWTALGSNPNLKPEESNTYEVIAGYTAPSFDISINPYYNSITNLITDIGAVSMNHGKMYSTGVDILFNSIFSLPFITKVKSWIYYSYTKTSEKKYNSVTGAEIGERPIGDIAEHKLYFGVNFSFKDLSVNLRGRLIGGKTTVDSNPIRNVPSYTTLDLNIRYDNLFYRNFTLSFRILNLFNETYFHSGIRKANSGNTPGYWEGDLWYGSRGFYNSLLPQPGRGYYLSLSYQF